MHIALKRIYDEPSAEDGTRVLVDRLWPRGVSKEAAQLDEWAKDLAPSTALRQWFGHEPAKLKEFRARYRRELAQNQEALDRLLERIDRRRRLTLLYAAQDALASHAEVLKQALEARRAES